MTIDQLIMLVATVTLIQMMVTIGLGVTVGQLSAVVRDWRTLLRAGAANYVAVPAAALVLLLLFQSSPMVAVGFLIAAVCPGAPYGPPLTSLAKGNTALSVGLMVVLAASSAVFAPLLLVVLLPLVAGPERVDVDVVRLVATLSLCQFLPLGVGLFVRRKRPALADRLQQPSKRLTSLLNLALLMIILIGQFQMLAEITLRAYFGMTCLLAATLAAGWLLGGPNRADRKSLTIVTAIRNARVSLAIAATSFPGTAAVTAATVYGLFQTLAMVAICFAWGRAAAHDPAANTQREAGDAVGPRSNVPARFDR